MVESDFNFLEALQDVTDTADSVIQYQEFWILNSDWISIFLAILAILVCIVVIILLFVKFILRLVRH